jgi:uncharacterized protein DUF4160
MHVVGYGRANGAEERPVPHFFSHEPNERSHVHVDRDNLSAKFWLQPLALARNFGFPPGELRRIRVLRENNLEKLLEAWHGHISAKR